MIIWSSVTWLNWTLCLLWTNNLHFLLISSENAYYSSWFMHRKIFTLGSRRAGSDWWSTPVACSPSLCASCPTSPSPGCWPSSSSLPWLQSPLDTSRSRIGFYCKYSHPEKSSPSLNSRSLFLFLTSLWFYILNLWAWHYGWSRLSSDCSLCRSRTRWACWGSGSGSQWDSNSW